MIDKLNATSKAEAQAANVKAASAYAFSLWNEEKLVSQANAVLASEAKAEGLAPEVNYLISGGLGDKLSAATTEKFIEAPFVEDYYKVSLPPVSTVIQAPTKYNSGTNIAGGAEFVTPQVIPQAEPLFEFKEGTIEAGVAANVGATYELATLPARAFAMPEETYQEVSGGLGEWAALTAENPIAGLRQPAGLVTGIGVTLGAAAVLPELGVTGIAATGAADAWRFCGSYGYGRGACRGSGRGHCGRRVKHWRGFCD